MSAGQNIQRLRHQPSFAARCAAGPVPVWSGRTDRHRLNPGGDRDANRALHMIAVCRQRYLKRSIARELSHALITDLPAQPTSSRPRAPITSLTCGARPIARTITTTRHL